MIAGKGTGKPRRLRARSIDDVCGAMLRASRQMSQTGWMEATYSPRLAFAAGFSVGCKQRPRSLLSSTVSGQAEARTWPVYQSDAPVCSCRSALMVTKRTESLRPK
eukprot:2383899-Heterocapsa_arctica.AAC.1